MEEYEYSFKVSSIKSYIDYCEEKNYEKKEVTSQNRIVYENAHNEHMIARITTKVKNGKKVTTFDCKNVGESRDDLKVSGESIPMKVTRNNRKEIESILEVLDFKEAANLTRTRYVYEKDNVKFELDDYTTPEMHVVALEGERSKVDVVYKDIKKKINNIIEDNN